MAKKQELFQAAAQIMKLETMSDHGIRVVIDTAELTDSEELAKLFRLKKGSIGWFIFKESEILPSDIPDYDPAAFDGDVTKTPSQRFRSVMYVYFTQVMNKKPEEFDAYYRAYYDKLISGLKEKLPPQNEA